jgi:hypothetical protein
MDNPPRHDRSQEIEHTRHGPPMVGLRNPEGSWQPDGGSVLHYPETLQISAPLFKSLVLKHQYTLPKGGFRNFLGVRPEKLSGVQLFVLLKKDRPQSLRTIVGGRRRPRGDLYLYEGCNDLKRDETWKYYDDKIPQRFDAYKAEVEGKGAEDNDADMYW